MQNFRYPSVSVTTTNPSVGTSGSAAPASSNLVAGINPSNNLQPLQTDASGNLKIVLGAGTLPVSGTVTANQGTAGASKWLVDGSGVTQPVSATALPLPTGAATSALQSSLNALFPASLGQKLMAASLAVTLASDQSAIPASQSGTWNINNVSGTVSLPTGAATSALQSSLNALFPTTIGQKTSAASLAVVLASDQTLPLPSGAATSALQTSGNSSLTTIATNIPAKGQAVMASSMPVAIASDQSNLNVAFGGKSLANTPTYNAYGTTNVTTSAYVQLIATTTSTANLIEIFDSSGQAMILAVGGAGSEVDQLFIVPGGQGQVPLKIPSGSRVSIKAKTANATSGFLLLNLYT